MCNPGMPGNEADDEDLVLVGGRIDVRGFRNNFPVCRYDVSMKHVFWIIVSLYIPKTLRSVRSSGMVVHPLAAGRSPTDDFSSLLLSLRFTRQREDNRFCSFPQRGRRGVKKKDRWRWTFQFAPAVFFGILAYRSDNRFCSMQIYFFSLLLGNDIRTFSFMGSKDPSLDKLA